MKVLLVSPSHNSLARGNTVTIMRWKNGLIRNGIDARSIGPEALGDVLSSWQPDLIHAHHAVICGAPAVPIAKKNQISLAISLSGTDLNNLCSSNASIALEILKSANVVLGPFADNIKKLTQLAGKMPPFYVIRRGITNLPFVTGNIPDKRLEIILVGGIRKVKGQLKALLISESLRTSGLPVRLTLVGPVVDDKYSKEVFDQLNRQPQDRYLPPLVHSEMGQIYEQADVLINCSDNEGASNAILEAWSYGVSVAAHMAPGNEELLRNAPDAIAKLFNDSTEVDQLKNWFMEILENKNQLHKKRMQIAREYVQEYHDEHDEIDELLAVYKTICNT